MIKQAEAMIADAEKVAALPIEIVEEEA